MTNERVLVHSDAETGQPSFPYFINWCGTDLSPDENNLLEFFTDLIKYGFPGVRCIPAGRDQNNLELMVFQADLNSIEGRMFLLFTCGLRNRVRIPPVQVLRRLLEMSYERAGEALPNEYQRDTQNV